jgi:hypothetical protein
VGLLARQDLCYPCHPFAVASLIPPVLAQQLGDLGVGLVVGPLLIAGVAVLLTGYESRQ